MRILPIGLILLLGAGVLRAQVDVELLIEQDQYLRDEPVPVKVRITNRSGQTLILGQSNDWLSFTVEIPGRGPVERVGQPPLASPFELESAHAATREVNIQPWFEISLPSRYSVSAMVRIKQWDKEVSTRPKPLEIVRGAKLWEQEIGVPTAAGAPSTGAPETRRFILQQANYHKRLKLYVRLSNESDTSALSVLPLGPLVSFGRPEAQVDEKSNLHVLFQSGARSFLYSVITSGGVLSTRHSYEFSATRPTLRLSETGKIIVAGGVRRLAATDVPADAPFTTAPSRSDQDVESPRK